MEYIPPLKSEGHHWWPECVSRHWQGKDGKTGWMKPDGSTVRLPPQVLGKITNGHHVQLSGEHTEPRYREDFSFERTFDKADNNFPSTIKWLESLERLLIHDCTLGERFLAQNASENQLHLLTECVVSLAVRSPRYRESCYSLTEAFMGQKLNTKEQNAVIGMNMCRSLRVFSDYIGAKAKFAILFSDEKEFIFGDGFFHNLPVGYDQPHTPKLLAPITPHVSVIIFRPSSYIEQPRLSTIVLSQEEVDQCNHTIQVYSRNALFFRSESPAPSDAFRSGQHLLYAHPNNPADALIQAVPGVIGCSGLDPFIGFTQ